MMKKYIGEYSREAIPYCGIAIWQDTAGKEFEITSVHLPTDEGSMWADKVIVSQDLVKFVWRTQESSLPWPPL